ncbi:MAG: sugar kinase [Pseudomonadota bacterium]
MSALKVKPAGACRYDIAALGEVMLRFDPGDSRISTADHFKVWEGGGEYNVAHGLSRCFEMNAAMITALVDNPVGHLIRNRMRSGGVDTTWIKWKPDDGIGESMHNSIYFMERGYGLRSAMGVFDRGHSAISRIKPGEFDWDLLFGQTGVRWFHTGGIMAGLSPDSARVVMEAMAAARKHGVVVSYDLNYRPSLWKRSGGKERAKEVNHAALEHADVLFGIESLDHISSGRESERFQEAIATTAQHHPHLKIIATSMRFTNSANRNDWSGLLWHEGEFVEGLRFENLDIYDRVGAGDGFAAGVIYGLLTGANPQEAVNYGVVHGALVMTTPGDTTMATIHEVETVLQGGRIGVVR